MYKLSYEATYYKQSYLQICIFNSKYIYKYVCIGSHFLKCASKGTWYLD